MRIRIVTLNVQNEAGDPRRVSIINREIQRLTPDLLTLQEVIYKPKFDQLDKLLEGTNLKGTHQAQVRTTPLPFEDRYGGNAVASRWPYRIVELLDLRFPDAMDLPWSTIGALVQIPDLGDLFFIAFTGAWRLDAESARERQVLAISELDARHRTVLPTIIAGDFNATPDSSSIRYMTGLQSLAGRSVHYHDAWAVANNDLGYTWTTDNQNARLEIDQIVRQPNHRRRIDYVFIGSFHAHPKAYARVQSAALAFDKPIDGIWASDHFGVVVDLDIGLLDISSKS